MQTTVDPSVSKRAIPSDRKDFATCCVLCSHNCGIRVDIEDNKMVAVRADDRNPITEGYLCNKAFSVTKYVHHNQRVTQPLRRNADGELEPVSWDVAITEIASRLNTIRQRHSPRAVGLVGVGGQANHMDAPFALGLLRGMGSRRWFNAFAQEKTQHNLLDQWMFDASPASWLHADDHNTRYLFVLGTNPKVSNRGHNATETLKRLAKDADATVVVADPRETETTRGADVHLQVKPGTDCYMLLGIAAIIVAENLYDQRFVTERSLGWEGLRRLLNDVSIDDMSARCNIDRDQLEKVARGFATSGASSILMDLGAEQTPFSTLNSYLVRVLLAITGNLGRVGGNLFHQMFNPPDPRGLERGATERALVSNIPAIRAMGSYGMFSPSLVPEEVLNDHPERLRALIVEGSNPLLSFSDTGKWREAVAALDLLVVIDPALTETAQEADYVLPTPVGYEKWEVSNFPKHVPQIHTQVRPPALAGPANALPEPEIYARLAEAMDLFGPPPKPVALAARFAGQARGRMLTFLAATAMAKRKRGTGSGVQNRLIFWLYRTMGKHFDSPSLTIIWLICMKNAMSRRAAVLRTLGPKWRFRGPFSLGEELFRRVLAHPEGVEVARLDLETNLVDHIGFKDNKVRLSPEQMLSEARRALRTVEVDDAEFPFVLSAGFRTQWTANTIQRDPSWRKGKGPHCALYLNPDDAAQLGVAAKDSVVLATSRGEVTLPATIDKRLRRGHVLVPNGFGMKRTDAVGVDGVNLNELTASAERDPFTGCPHHKYVRCRVTAAH